MSETTVVELVPDEVTQFPPRPLGSRIAAALLRLLIRTAITVAVIVVIVLLRGGPSSRYSTCPPPNCPRRAVCCTPRGIRRLRQHAA